MSYVVIFRGRRACPCQAEWIPGFEAELRKRGLIQQTVDIAQLIGGAAASGGTHAAGGAIDIWQSSWGVLRCARDMGADASWGRTRAQNFTPHAHIVLRGCEHNGPARYQITSTWAGVDHNKNGLANGGRDDGPRPLSGLTWREGLAKYRGDEDELTPDEKRMLREVHENSRYWAPGKKGVRNSGAGYNTLVRMANRVGDVHRTLSPKGQLRNLFNRLDAAVGSKSKLQTRVYELHRSWSPRGQLRTAFEKATKQIDALARKGGK